MFPSIMSPTAVMVTEAAAFEALGLALGSGAPAVAWVMAGLATPAVITVVDVTVPACGRPADEQAESTSKVEKPVIAQNLFIISWPRDGET